MTRTLLLVLALAGCGDDEPAPTANLAPLHYEYLTKIRLNVGQVQIEDHAAPASDDDISAQAPTPPAQAMRQMAADRLFAAGNTGTATFSIDQASIVKHDGGVLDGTLGAHLDIVTAGGQHAGFAEAHVSRQHTPGSDDEDRTQLLYDMTKQMMDEMNVELEYQVKRSLRDWLVPEGATPAPVATAPLPGPAPVAAPVLPPVLPPAVPPPDTAAPAPGSPQLSPPPGFLRLPGSPQ